MFLQRWNEGLLPSVGGQLQESRRIHRQEVQTTYVTVVGSLEYQRMCMDMVEGVPSNGYAMPCFVELITPPAKAAKGKSCDGVSHSKWRSVGMTHIQVMRVTAYKSMVNLLFNLYFTKNI